MGLTVDFSPNDISDLEAIVREIAKVIPIRGERFGMELVEKTDVLEKYPRIGGKVPEFDDESIRELHHMPYRIIYLVQENQSRIDIPRYWHASRGFPQLIP